MTETDGRFPRSMHRLDQVYLENHPERKRECVVWIQEHGLDPNDVPLDAGVLFLDREHIEIQLYDRPKGMVEVDENGEVRTRWMVVEIKRTFPMDCIA